MRTHLFTSRLQRLAALASILALLGATAGPFAAARSVTITRLSLVERLGATAGLFAAAGARDDWRTLFPPAVAYPHGTHLLPMQAATRATALVDPVTAAQVVRLGFVAGGVQEAVLPAQAAASVTVLTFRTTRGAATFLRQDQPPALGDPTTAGETIAGLGDGARYLTGSSEGCCGPAAPPLGILLLRQGTAVVQVLTQPADRALCLRLGRAALRH